MQEKFCVASFEDGKKQMEKKIQQPLGAESGPHLPARK